LVTSITIGEPKEKVCHAQVYQNCGAHSFDARITIEKQKKKKYFATLNITPITLKYVCRSHYYTLKSRVGGALQSADRFYAIWSISLKGIWIKPFYYRYGQQYRNYWEHNKI